MAINLNNKRSSNGVQISNQIINVTPQVYTVRVEFAMESRFPGGVANVEVIYKCEALPSVAALIQDSDTGAPQVNSSNIWRIAKIEIRADGTIEIKYPNGDPSFSYAFTDRLTLTYK